MIVVTRVWRYFIATLIASLLALVGPNFAEASSQSPGTAAQVAQLVASSHSIVRLTSAVRNQLLTAPLDFSWTNYPTRTFSAPSPCTVVSHCVYGNRLSKTTVVLFGDSHAVMWLPAFASAASAHGFKLVFVWRGWCEPAAVSVYQPSFNYPAVCNAWRSAAISDIKKLHAKLVVLAERTTLIPSGPNQYFTGPQWQSALETTIRNLRASSGSVAVMEDTVFFDSKVPACLSLHPTAVQRCAVPIPNPKKHGLQGAEFAASLASGAHFIKTQNWFCTTSCSPVIGNFIPFIDDNHVSYTYSAYLSGVVWQALSPMV